MNHPLSLPARGRPKDALLQQMQQARQADLNWRDGRVFSLVFFAGEEAQAVAKEAYTLFFSENGLNPTAFPSLRRFETEVVSMTAALLGGSAATAGNMTSGGTESILLAVLAAREWARQHRPAVKEPEILLPVSAHPAFDKAAHYFDLRVIRTPVTDALTADVAAMASAVTPSTVLIAGSAPSYPHGVVDPIAELAALAGERGILCHVDACVGGFMLPFVRQLGYPVPPFDLGVPGVTSISADIHKYGYAAKGASVILYRDAALRRHQLFAVTDWPGGIYASPTLAGTRPGGAIAAAWAIMQHLGEEGYLAIAQQVMETAAAIRQGIDAIPGLRVLGDPPMSLMAVAADKGDVYDVGDEMGLRGWHLDRQQFPPSLHLTLNRAHVGQAEAFLADLADAAAAARRPSLRKAGTRALLGAARSAARLLPPPLLGRLTSRTSGLVAGGGLPRRSAAMYGMMGTLPNRGDLRELVLDLLEQFTTAQGQ